MASSAEEVRLFLANRAAQPMNGACDAAAAVVAAASSAAAAAPAFADAAVTPIPVAASSNPKYGHGSRLSGAAKKTEQRRMRSYLSITNAEQQSVQALFSDQPTRQIYLANGGASCGVSHAECHALLSQYGRLTRLVLIGQAPFALAEFESAEQTARCHAALDAFIWNRGDAAGVDAADAERARQLFVQYAREDASTFLKEGKHALQIPNAVPLEQISPQSVCSLGELPDVINRGVLSGGSVPGLLLVRDFISEAEEASLLAAVDQYPWEEVRLRQVQHHGFRFNYAVNKVDADEQMASSEEAEAASGSSATSSDNNAGAQKRIPSVFQFLLDRMRLLGALDEQQPQQLAAAKASATSSPSADSAAAAAAAAAASSSRSYLPAQLTVNRYRVGDGIPSHVDSHSPFTDIIVSLSLGPGSVVMDFAPTSTTKQRFGEAAREIHVPLPPRSLLALTGAARYGYTHGITARRTDRINGVLTPRSQRTSLTFRQLRSAFGAADGQARCICTFTSSCDSSPEQQNGEGASGDSVQLKRRTKSTFATVKLVSPAAVTTAAGAAAAVAPSPAAGTSPPSSARSSASSSRSSSPSPSPPSEADLAALAATLPPPPRPLAPDVERCHLLACAAGRDTYKDPATGYSVFTAPALHRIRKGSCCGNACRHCPFEHANVKTPRRK